jgi:formylglycine-generating enzyme required for sulfatase activity
MAAIFISYRRAQTSLQARSVYERLLRHFGDGRVFMDVDDIPPGTNFRRHIEAQLVDCRAMVALIGREWLSAQDEQGRRKLDNPRDFVRVEIGTALKREILVIPVLFDDAAMPQDSDIPEDLHGLLDIQALKLDFAHFNPAMERLCGALRTAIEPGEKASPVAASEPIVQQAVPSEPKAPVIAPAASSPSKSTVARPPWATDIGRDQYGEWAEFEYGKVCQRMRWLPPGRFMMGSADDEPERGGDEGPQHEVRLTEGFWLADTACTQAMWLAVAGGSNPAHFKDDLQNPVESIAIADVETFLKRLGGTLPGQPQALLPTEAQWEYACRAGTTTPFSFGEQITSEQVNYDGNHPYDNPKQQGRKGLFRNKTVPVKSLPPNAWGLYEMHGNVWEWCADHLGAYSEEPKVDPRGGSAVGVLRALRGGGWDWRARAARSARRDADHPGNALRYIGFRFSLRPQEPGRGAPVSGGGAAAGGTR